MADGARGERLELLDALRGAAVLGILVDNIQLFAMPHEGFFHPISFGDATGWNRVAWHVANLLFNGRFFSMLMMVFGAAMLFGGSGPRDRGVHLRRMAMLAVLGLAHGGLLWDGDILFVMALAGTLVYPARRLGTRWLLVAALAAGLGGPALMVATGAAELRRPLTESACFDRDWEPSAAATARQVELQRGSWSDQQSLRVARSLDYYSFVIPVYLVWRVAALALLGMAFYRLGLLSGALHSRTCIRIAALSLGAGLPLSVAAVQAALLPSWQPRALFPLALAYEFGVVTIASLAWVMAIDLAARQRAGRAIVSRLAVVGRLSLSNYIVQTLICLAVFCGGGLGLFGRVPRIGQAGLVLMIWGVQVLASVWWQRRFAHGPLEWLLRAVAYGRRLPWRRSPA
ncbi:MAG: DUF418 domain-containing protein [bacterium]|nr:DUF418 domain-containing protein [bacterium]